MGRENTVPMYTEKVWKGKRILMHITTREPRDIMLTERSHHERGIMSGQHVHVVPRAPEA